MSRTADIFVTALVPVVWGSTYLVTTQALPIGYPITLALLRALPAGLLLLAFTKCLPPVSWLGRILVLGALNFTIFWSLLFVAAYRLPGGVAATLGAFQPIMVIMMARGWLGTPISAVAVMSALVGVFGVGLLVLGPEAELDLVGVAAGLGGAASMAAGTVLSRKWQPDVSALSFTAWQLTAGGLLLLPIALMLEPSLPALSLTNLMGLAWLGLIGAAAAYALWFRGIARIGPGAVSMLGMISPLTAMVLGWLCLNEGLTMIQLSGALVVLASVWAGQVATRRAARTAR